MSTSRRRVAVTAGLAAATFVAVLGETRLWDLAGSSPAPSPSGPVLLLGLVLAAAILIHRAAPAIALVVAAGAVTALGAWQPTALAPFLFTPALVTIGLAYLAGLTGRTSACWGVAGLAAAGAGVAAATGRPDGALFVPVVLTILGLVPWLIGRSRHQQWALVRAGAERIAQLEQAQHSVAAQARLRERAALAEEMHDSLGHELSLIALRAGGLELAPDLPARQREAAGELRTATAAATARLAEIVAVLRDGPAPARPAPGAPAELVARARGSGLAVQLRENGQPPAALAATVHRLVQEGLTNAAKHAPGAAVTVAVDSGAEQTTVTVTNPPPPGPPAAEPGTGHGLAGLRERVRLLGGELSVTRPGGGFHLTATLPHRPTGVRRSG